jgi:hypothetical protein
MNGVPVDASGLAAFLSEFANERLTQSVLSGIEGIGVVTRLSQLIR